MTDKEMNVAIHQAIGFDVMSDGWIPSYNNPDNSNFDIPSEPLEVPDYCNDLNAMHDAENWLEYHCEQWFAPEGRDDTACEAYIYHLKCACRCYEWMIIGATAGQRAEAFLRTVGKWKEASV